MANEAAERLASLLDDINVPEEPWNGDSERDMLNAALAAERRATVERIRLGLAIRQQDREHPVVRWPEALHELLDEEAK